ncbi:MAG: hypothetical protein IK065_04150 [Neisseriaceae bacterium]|nr:hypothetical protein [Neisseriaceae bacterium]
MNTALKNEPPSLATDDMVLEAKLAKQHFEQTGLHIRLQELQQWVEELRHNPDEPMPQTHR